MKLLGILVVAIVGVVTQLVADSCSAPEPVRPTQVHFTRLFAEDGGLVPPFKVTARVSGATCQAGSQVVADAWGELDTSHPLNTVALTAAGSSEVRQAKVTDVWP
ncbi:hypothetical protein [Streptomyces sp. NPDC089799]|uniref:hypothetical protein n=1 Tax=Streptomyces sp. NPDC089799 TaxID=3155066 RepID=UPI0034164C7C